MNTFTKRMVFGFIIGVSTGFAITNSALASPSDQSYFETETFVVKKDRVTAVLKAMNSLGLSEDVDFAWLSRTLKGKSSNFICYSTDCHQWATQTLKTIASAPERPEELMGTQWRVPAFEAKKAPELSQDDRIKQRQKLRYSKFKSG